MVNSTQMSIDIQPPPTIKGCHRLRIEVLPINDQSNSYLDAFQSHLLYGTVSYQCCLKAG
jgi:hypothetical protein